MTTSTGPVIDTTTVTSLLAALSLFVIAYALGNVVLPKQSSKRTRVLFVWHLFDSLIHFTFEGSFLYNCFFTYIDLPGPPSYLSPSHAILTPPGVYFLGQSNRLYGSAFGNNPTAKLWQEYTKADKRWGGADLTVISLELLTVLIGGPLAAYICYLLSKGHGDTTSTSSKMKSLMTGKLSFWLIVLATGELYGGFMTFAPEWLSGSTGLDTSNWMYLWLYLVFFNVLWVFLPLYALVMAYRSLTGASPLRDVEKKKM
ncbi:Emopamil-binding protein [Microthyrium microscopicum]|uniref:Emopamil-binding protein n=1 Tax=Microthyrium microscopicum TaxID=703497 RepID=A0A6A6UPW5_9PEZI|nr:Emopamil-binding protein [Microthyrium microscopicum]